jgi:sulfite reductase (ferredoxin)
MTAYTIPKEVTEDFIAFSRQYNDFIGGKLDAPAFKTYRVPFGIYEQRETDTYMVRVKLAGGLITPKQLYTLGELAERYGHKKVHVTTRGGAQLHYIKIDHFLPVIEALHKVGLTGRGGGGNTVRNITADPYAGIAQDEIFDVTPHAVALTETMLALKDSYALPRKFKIAFSGSPADRGGATYIDVGFIAKIKDEQRGFRVFVGGGMGAKSRLGDSLIDFLPEGDIFILSQAIKELFNEKGNRRNKHQARLRFLIEELGLESFKKLVIEKMAALRASDVQPLTITPYPELLPRDTDLLPILNEEQSLWWQRFVVPQKQKGYYSVKVPLLLGDISSDHAKELATLIQTLSSSDDVIRFAANQNVYLRNFTANQLLTLYPLIRRISPLHNKSPLIGNIVVCTGAATCQLGVTIPRGALLPIERALTNANIDLDALNDFKIHLSGCPNSCGKHAVADLGFFGKLLRKNGMPYPAYNILVGAKIGEDETRFARKITDISAFHLPSFVVSVLKTWLPLKDQYRSFADWIDQGGESVIVDLAAALADIPDFDEDKNPYFDYSAKELFSLKGRGAGECSAGMYDLIEADKKALTAALRAPLTDDNLKTIRLLSARMLLITRGEEARNEEDVLRAFKKSFVDSGLISSTFTPLLVGTPSPEVVKLAEAVIRLYGTMDHTLRFAVERKVGKTPIPATTTISPPLHTNDDTIHRFKDYRGVACPMNFVKTKMDLAQMKSGELLEIVLDDGAPIDNVPQSVTAEGHTILSQTRQGDVWHVKIRKK